MKKPRGRIPEAARMLTQRAQIPAPIAFLPVPVLPKRVAAAYLGISVRTLEDYVADGIVQAVQYTKGGDLFFRVVTLDRFIEASERGNPASQAHSPPHAAEEDDAVAH